MGPVVWLAANTLGYPDGGGHLWAYLNWALGLKALGCQVVWLEGISWRTSLDDVPALVRCLQDRLRPYGLGDSLAICPRRDEPLPEAAIRGCIGLEAAPDADLLLNLAYDSCAPIFGRFRRTAMVDIDPGLFQVWVSEGVATLPENHVYFSIGETVGRPDARFPSGGVTWHYTPPCVSLDWWPVCPPCDGAAFTTVSHWDSSREWVTFAGESYHNDKRTGFLPFLSLPRHTRQPLELAICLKANERLELAPDQEEEQRRLEALGWKVVHSHLVASTASDYQRYVRRSYGEFSCVKPSCIRLQNAWISDRSLCYLASGKPVVVQDTGPSRFLPAEAGLFRFRDLAGAVRCLERAAADYEEQCRLARALAEEHFDARKVVTSVLERALA